MIQRAIVYIHGMGGSASEAAFYQPLFPGDEAVGLDYQTFTPWETGAEIRAAFTDADTMQLFADRHGASLTVMEGGEHWFHTEEQMTVLKEWITAAENPSPERTKRH